MNPLQQAQFWQKLGIATIPIRYKDKRPELKSWQEFQKRLPTDTELSKWFSGPFHNLGIVVGWNNLVVIDFDSDTEYALWQLWIARRSIYRWIRQTLQVKTARGVHVYVTTSQPAQNAKLPGIDIKAVGGYVLSPPSVHPSGVEYSVLSGTLPVRIEALSDVLPAELLAIHTELPEKRTSLVSSPVVLAAKDDPWAKADQLLEPDRDLIEQIKQRYRIEDFFVRLVQKRDRWHMTNCLFHDDKSPSMWVDMERQICGCFAGCTPQPCDVIDLYARLHNLSIQDAIRVMARSL
ncbi:MAG: hypothetical protein HPY59_16415 [Anaerolineae bacterium]|nr:hypothetical protein [Anaerolineae bacterium]